MCIWIICCDKCTQLEFYSDVLIETPLKQHKSGKTTCAHYGLECGRSCKCVACMNCIMFELKRTTCL